jgi:metal-responsive CopG/Arc/MetJ family transcriptional regulator
MKTRLSEMIGLKLPAELAAEIRRAAREDDRTVSGFLRRLIAAALRERRQQDHDDGTASR